VAVTATVVPSVQDLPTCATITIISPPSTAPSRKTSTTQPTVGSRYDNPLWDAGGLVLPADVLPPPAAMGRKRAVEFQMEGEDVRSAVSR
jgi:hypothetical protein